MFSLGWLFKRSSSVSDGYITRVQNEEGEWVTLHDSLSSESELLSDESDIENTMFTSSVEELGIESGFEELSCSDDFFDGADSMMQVNPVTGLPGDGFIDAGGNVWNTDSASMDFDDISDMGNDMFSSDPFSDDF
ncbi:hypothetical protein Ga0061065_1245 [Marinomonas fungiae]|uniref:Uncharacterized protein n=2 Tax=Marinomonas fungiae TaxID=1137284 RepID=A0A0K6IUS2_9GAMM|nr:hypothetical protein Ga0061065_1245 [Marinomonas fungiae]